MFTDRGMTYSDAGSILRVIRSGHLVCIGYSYPVTDDKDTSVTEEEIDISDIYVKNGMLHYKTKDGYEILQQYYPSRTYSDWKSAIVKWRYSNDDQIAILLNEGDSDDDRLRYERMQKWRTWAAKLARAIININNK